LSCTGPDPVAARLSGVTRGLRGEGCHVFHVNNAARSSRSTALIRAVGRRRDRGAELHNIGYAQYSIRLPGPGGWRVRFSFAADWLRSGFGGWASNDTRAGEAPQDGLAHSGQVGIGPYTAVILSQDPAQ
jgi:1,4-alpha-glucan branching enzyme